jgi:hypothetical protein
MKGRHEAVIVDGSRCHAGEFIEEIVSMPFNIRTHGGMSDQETATCAT